MTQAEESPATQLLHLLDGFRVAQAIHVAAVLGLADLLEDGPLSSQDLAAATDTKAQPLYRLLRALAALGVFREEPDHRFVLTPLGGCLRMTGPHALGPVAVQDLQPEMWEAWGHLLQSVRTGQTPFATHMEWTYGSIERATQKPVPCSTVRWLPVRNETARPCWRHMTFRGLGPWSTSVVARAPSSRPYS